MIIKDKESAFRDISSMLSDISVDHMFDELEVSCVFQPLLLYFRANIGYSLNKTFDMKPTNKEYNRTDRIYRQSDKRNQLH